MSTDPLTMRIELIEKQIAAMMEDKFIQKINSQEKEIEFLKKTALGQEIKINDIETLLNKWLIVNRIMRDPSIQPESYEFGVIYNVLTKHLYD